MIIKNFFKKLRKILLKINRKYLNSNKLLIEKNKINDQLKDYFHQNT